MQYSVPAVALNEAAREFTRLGEVTAGMLEDSCRALVEKRTELTQRVLIQEEKVVDPVFKELSKFIDVLMRADLSQVQQKRCFQILSLLTDLERVGDMAEDIAQYAMERVDNNVPFSDQAIVELENLWQHAHQTYTLAIRAFQGSDRAQAREVCRMEAEFDRMYWHTRQLH
jgi:phosphate:Na+ symporter